MLRLAIQDIEDLYLIHGIEVDPRYGSVKVI